MENVFIPQVLIFDMKKNKPSLYDALDIMREMKTSKKIFPNETLV